MLVIKAYMWPGGDAKGERYLSGMTLACVGATKDGERAYRVEIMKDTNYGGPENVRPRAPHQIWRGGDVRGHFPGRRGVWDLVGGALKALLHSRLDSYTRGGPSAEDAPVVQPPRARFCYVAGPFAGSTREEVARNVHRAAMLGRYMLDTYGWVPIVVHPSIQAGVYGDDSVPEQRDYGIAAVSHILNLVASQDGVVVVIARDDGALSAGTQRELDALKSINPDAQIFVKTWAEWVKRGVKVTDSRSRNE